MQPLGDIAFDHMNMWQIKNIISQVLQMLQSPNLVGTQMRIKCYPCYMSQDLLYVIYCIPICHSYISYMPRDHVIY